MHMEIQPAFKASSILKGLGSDPVLTDVIPSSSQLFESFEPLQTPTVSALKVLTNGYTRTLRCHQFDGKRISVAG